MKANPGFHNRATCVMTDRCLHLNLSAGESLPTALCWLVEDGYLMLSSWSLEGEDTILGLWGPGKVVIPSLLGKEALQLISLSSVTVQEWTPSPEQVQHVLRDQILQLSTLLQLSQIRRAEPRLFRLLLWLGERFGRVNSRGVSLSFETMNLTHRHLAQISGLTRVTVTKSLSAFRQEGRMTKLGNDELLVQR